ncbi:MAG: glycosyltransferase family 4 protein [Thaumarchaeota archaeon]|nr:glycosyltransferase family 4 protein [Nitrososphaerota archaeon]
MKIAQVNVYFQPFMVGGAEWYVYNISRELVKRGHEVHVFTSDTYNGNAATSSETIDGIIIHRLPLKIDWSYRMKVWDGLLEALCAQQFDIIHTYDYAQPHSVVALKAGERTGTGTVLTVFDVHSLIPRVWYKQIPMRVMEGYMARRTLSEASVILVRAPNLVDPLVELGGPPSRIRVTSSGVRDESLGSFDGEGFKKRHGIQGSPTVLFVGRLNPLKGPQYLIRAAPMILKSFPDTQFVLVGPDQSRYAEVLRSEAANNGLTSNFHLLGPVYDFGEKMAAYSSCDVFALPTAYEGTSQSLFEAMAQGKPVVSTKVGGVPSQLTDGVEGRLVPYADSEALGSAIVGILEDGTRSTEMGAKGRQRVLPQRYSVLASDLEKIYEEVRVHN